MKTRSAYIFIGLALLAFYSCGSKQTDSQLAAKQETPKALKEDVYDLKSYSRGNSDLVDALYNELVDASPALKMLEHDISEFSTKPDEIQKNFGEYDSKSKSYYHSAANHTNEILDSVLRKKMVALINNSNNQYSGKTSELNSLLLTIADNKGTLYDDHTVLKVVLTLPVIEKYQDQNMPNKNEIGNVIKEQQRLIERTDSLTPKY